MSGVDAVVAGAGGFIGGHLTRSLIAEGKTVRAVDIKPLSEWYQRFDTVEELVGDVSLLEVARATLDGGATEVYNLAADMGGMGFIENNKAACMLSVLTSTHVLLAAKEAGVDRFFYASSACVYTAEKQTEAAVTALREDDVYPAMPEDGYGWEKLFSERLARHFLEDYGVETRVARFHNVYGPHGTWDGGREKAPAAACRKVAMAVLTGNHEVEIWGDGEQTRSFTYIDDCIHGICMITRSDFADPINLGSSELTTINSLYGLVADIAGVELAYRHIPGPLGVRGRNSDNTLILKEFDWEPSTRLRDGLAATYAWVFEEAKARLEGRVHTI